MCSIVTSPDSGWRSAARRWLARWSRSACEPRAELRAGETAMRDPVLLLGRQFGHRAAVSGDDEHGVVAEPRFAARRFRDLAVHLALEELDVPVGRRESSDADEAGGAIRDAVEKGKELRVPFLGARVLAEEAPAAHARRPTEREDLETRVVGDRLQSTRRGVPARLGRRVLGERGRILVRLRRDRVEVARRDEVDVEAAEYLSVLTELSRVRRAEADRMSVLRAASHTSMVAPAGSSCRPRPNRHGAHQFARPRRRIVAGTTSARTRVASRSTAMVSPMPTDLMITTSASANAMNTPTMIAAAPVMSLPLRSRPIATAPTLSPVRRYSSWIRERRNTS